MSEQIRVNGELRPYRHNELLSLLKEIGIAPDAKGVAVAVNGEVVPRARWKEQELQPGDAVEVVGAVQGG